MIRLKRLWRVYPAGTTLNLSSGIEQTLIELHVAERVGEPPSLTDAARELATQTKRAVAGIVDSLIAAVTPAPALAGGKPATTDDKAEKDDKAKACAPAQDKAIRPASVKRK